MRVATGTAVANSIEEAVEQMMAHIEELNSEGFFDNPESYEKAKQNVRDSRGGLELMTRKKLDS